MPPLESLATVKGLDCSLSVEFDEVILPPSVEFNTLPRGGILHAEIDSDGTRVVVARGDSQKPSRRTLHMELNSRRRDRATSLTASNAPGRIL